MGTSVDEGIQKYPWESKIEKVIFRGHLTGADFDYHETTLEHKYYNPEKLKRLHYFAPQRFPRLEMILLSSRRPELLDAGLIGIYKGLEEPLHQAFAP